MNRDPRHDPREGDELLQHGTWGCVLIVDRVSDGKVAYRLTDGAGGLIAAHSVSLEHWRRWIPKEVKLKDRFEVERAGLGHMTKLAERVDKDGGCPDAVIFDPEDRK